MLAPVTESTPMELLMIWRFLAFSLSGAVRSPEQPTRRSPIRTLRTSDAFMDVSGDVSAQAGRHDVVPARAAAWRSRSKTSRRQSRETRGFADRPRDRGALVRYGISSTPTSTRDLRALSGSSSRRLRFRLYSHRWSAPGDERSVTQRQHLLVASPPHLQRHPTPLSSRHPTGRDPQYQLATALATKHAADFRPD